MCVNLPKKQLSISNIASLSPYPKFFREIKQAFGCWQRGRITDTLIHAHILRECATNIPSRDFEPRQPFVLPLLPYFEGFLKRKKACVLSRLLFGAEEEGNEYNPYPTAFNVLEAPIQLAHHFLTAILNQKNSRVNLLWSVESFVWINT
jgi:hypothetical protein